MSGILDQILAGVQKLPGNAVGAPVDLANSIVNLGKAAVGYVGSKTGVLRGDQLPQLEDNPIGGSKWINQKFGLGESKGSIDEATQLLGGFVSPGSAALKAGAILKSVILPAAVLHDTTTLNAAQKLIDAGRADKVYDITGIFPDLDAGGYPVLKTVLPDTNVSLPVGGVLRTMQKTARPDLYPDIPVRATTRLPTDFSGTMNDVISHPDLFNLDPSLAAIPVTRLEGAGGGGSFSPSTGKIKIGDYVGMAQGKDAIPLASTEADQKFTSTALHETQHAIQESYGFSGGSSPGFFIRNPSQFMDAQRAARQDLSPIGVRNLATLDSADQLAMDHYMNTSGEVEARIVQQQFTTGDYSVSPATTMKNMEAGGDKLIRDVTTVPKVDDAPDIQAIMKYYNIGTPQAGV